MGNYKLTAKAEADLERIWLYGFREYGEIQADEYFFAFFERFEEIAKNPYQYQSVDYIREGYRRSVCGIDTIYFRIEANTVEIISILGRQDTQDLS